MTNDTPATGPVAATQAVLLREAAQGMLGKRWASSAGEWGEPEWVETDAPRRFAEKVFYILSEPSPQPVAGGSVREAPFLWPDADVWDAQTEQERIATINEYMAHKRRAPAASAPQPASGGVREDMLTAIAAENAAYLSDVRWWLEIAQGKGHGSIEEALNAAPNASKAAREDIPTHAPGSGEVAPDEDWLTDVIDDSLDMDWTGRVGAKAIIAAWGKRHD